MRFLLLLTPLIFLMGCSRGPVSQDDWIYANRVQHEFPTDDITSIVEDYVVELKHEKRIRYESSMICVGDGHGPKLRLEFISQNLMMLCEAREFLVEIVEEFLHRLNTRYVDPLLRPEPFTSANLELYIKFESFYGVYCDPYYIGWIALENDMAFYYAFTLDDFRLNSWDKHSEPYYKSKSIARAQIAAEKGYQLTHPKKTPRDILQIQGF
jgi:hypothetical protein